MASETISYRIKELDPDIIHPSTKKMGTKEQGGSKLVVIGKPGTGKSSIISSLIYEKSHIFPVGIVMNGTEDSNHHYAGTKEKPGMIPPAFVYNSLEKTKLEDFIKRQKIAKEHLANPWSLLVIDDCMDDPKIFNDTLFQSLYKLGRHWKMFYIFGLQYCLDIKPTIRVNIDGTFILRELNIKIRKSLWENYAGVVGDFTTFCSIMDQLTDDYTALYINNATTSNKIEDCVFWYKAKSVPDSFKFGCQEYWTFNDIRYDPQSESS
jgi:GTPase SAR1 family protein